MIWRRNTLVGNLVGLALSVLCVWLYARTSQAAFWSAMSGIATGMFLLDTLRGQWKS